MDNTEQIILELAQKVADKGGRAYYVGGYVRDCLIGISCGDRDIEVYGIPFNDLCTIVNGIGKVDLRGSDYGIISLVDYDIDVALPRTEVRTGSGHRDFIVKTDPALTPEVACRRRDFTINAMLMDVLTNEIVDPYNGMEDIRHKIIRHIDDTSFPEDQLRVLRACQFAARFEYTIASDTVKICQKMSLDSLSGSRVASEMKKALVKAAHPSLFFENLRLMGQLGYWFPELEKLIGLEQDPVYHPEGDVWTHTMQVLDRAAEIRDKSSDIYCFMLLALTHDFGKIVTTERKNGRIHAYGHEKVGIDLIEKFVLRIGGTKRNLIYLSNLVPLHMTPGMIVHDCSSIKASNKMFDSAMSPEDLILIYLADHGHDPSGETFLRERLALYKEIMSRPFITGKDLSEAGITNSTDFSRMLALAHKLRLAGIERNDALKQVLSSAKKIGN